MRSALLALLLVLALVPAASGQAVSSEGVGRAALGGSTNLPPRSVALEAALADAVRKVAEALLDPGTRSARVDEALGAKPGRLALAYRTVSEREETRTAASGRELVLTVDAQVDQTRVAALLRRAGLLAEEPAPPSGDGLGRLVIEPVPAWSALMTLRRRFVDLGAQRVLLSQVEPGRVVLAVDGPDAASLARTVIADPPPGIRVEPTGQYDGAPRIRLESVPLPSGDGRD